jgi:hypothetical protein
MKIDTLFTADAHEQGSEVRIKDGNGKLTSLYITVKGTDSPTYQKELKRQKDAFFIASQASEEPDTDSFVIDALVACTVSWRGAEEKFSEKLCRELYTKAPYVRDQVDRFMVERKNFTKAKRKK